MHICSQCDASYDQTERACPKCGKAAPRSLSRCGSVGLISLWIAWAASMVAAVAALAGGAFELFDGNWVKGLILALVAAPVAYGHHVALGMAISYSERE